MDIQDVARAGQLASALEVSGYPKPGNVHRTRNLKESTFEQFIASSVAIGPVLLEVAERGFKAKKRKTGLEQIGLGDAIKYAIEDTMKWQRNGNTNLGVVMLLVPLAAAAGLTLAKDGKVEIKNLRRNLSRILKATTCKDAVNVFEAIVIADPAGLGKVTHLDVNDRRSLQKIREEGISLYDVMEMSSSWDNISKELVTGMRITFTFGYPHVRRIYEETNDMNVTTVGTFLEILSKYPDTLVGRTHGKRTADEVTRKARVIVNRGGMLTSIGESLVARLDTDLRSRNINPGTTADLTASSLMLAIIAGLRP